MEKSRKTTGSTKQNAITVEVLREVLSSLKKAGYEPSDVYVENCRTGEKTAIRILINPKTEA